MTARRWLKVLAITQLASCALPHQTNGDHKAAVLPRYRLIIKDEVAKRRFLLTLRSLDERPLCITFENWPDRQGHVHFGKTWVILRSHEGLYPARDENLGLCDGEGCIIRIAPHSELRGFVTYAQFGRSDSIAALSGRRLQYLITPSVCTD